MARNSARADSGHIDVIAAEFPQDFEVRNNFSGPDFLMGLRDDGGVSFGDWLVIGRCGQSCPVRRTGRQVFQKPPGGRQFIFRNPVDQGIQDVATHRSPLPLG
jgi:hypothetical protein